MAHFKLSLVALLLATAACAHTSDRVTATKTLLDLQRIYAKTSFDDGPSVDIPCVMGHCLTPSLGCLASSMCRNAMSCSQKCLKMWDNDTTHGKVIVQNCSNACSFTYEDKAYENFMECVTDNKCIAFPPIPNTCRSPNIHPQKNLSLTDMQGSWWVVKGLNPVYDCYPCQHLSMAPLNKTIWAYRPNYQVPLVNGSLLLIKQEMLIPNKSAPGGNISFVYHDVGMDHFETWWLLDKASDGSHMIMYYCGNTLQWYYEGALVLSKYQTLDKSVYADIATSFQKSVGLDLNDFCDVRATSTCPD